MTSPAPAITVLGGGTAGWMAACLFARAWPGARVIVIESPEIGIVGVGEGSTPQLRNFFKTLRIAESDWMPRANATYKAGIAFHGWSSRPGFGSYFHPFQTAIDGFTAPAFFQATRFRRTGHDVPAHPDRFFVPTAIAAARNAPVPPPNFPFDIGYGYHFDAHLIGAVLRDHAVGLGVVHLERRIVEVVLAEGGDVESLRDSTGETIGGDLFVDCSGFRSTIAQGALGVPFRSFGENLFNDRAVVMPTPADPHATNAHTLATALSNGWCWDIPLTNRTGNGYVYSARYTDPDAAEAELRAHLGPAAENATARHLTMNVGRVETSWTRNCLAVGLSQGFIEPLEATALHIIQATVEGFIDDFTGGGFTQARRDAFNARINRRYDGIRDYIVAHYRMNSRTDTPYWRDNAANQDLSDSLKAIMTCWFTGGDLEREIADQGIGGYYSAVSWHCLLGGYGTYPAEAKLRPPAPELALPDFQAVDTFIAGCARNFDDHKTVLERLAG